MPIGYVIPVALLAFCTATAVAGPRPKRTTQNFWGYWVTFQINEQPFAACFVLAVLTAFTFAQGDLSSPGGLVALGVAALTAAGLAELARRAFAAGPALRRALAAGGIDFAPGRRPWAHILLAPLAVRRRDVTRVPDIAYGDAGRRNRLDVYHRRDRPRGAPVLVYFHGGGFRMGHKNREGRALLNHLAARGWVCVSANYRLEPAARFPDYLVDAKRVVAWVRAHAGDYGADPRTVVAAGSSAGGHLAVMLALTAGDPRLEPGFADADASVAGAIGLYGYYGRAGGPGSSPFERVSEAALPESGEPAALPPMLFVHGDKDSSTLVEDTRELVGVLRAAGLGPALYAELPGAQHTFDLFFSLRYSIVVEGVTAFCDRVRARQNQGSSWTPVPGESGSDTTSPA